MIANWWNSLILTQQIFALFALPATVILVIQTILLLIGLGAQSGGLASDGGGQDGDFGADDSSPAEDSPDTGLQLFSVRGLVAFFAVGGWTGIALIDLDLPVALAGLLGLAIGFLALVLVAWLAKLVLGLQSAGNLDIRNAVGLIGRVYLTVPSRGDGSGKVTLILQERSIELEAATDQPEPIRTGSAVTVVGVRGNTVLVRSSDPGPPG